MKLNRANYFWQNSADNIENHIVDNLKKALPNYSQTFIELCIHRGLDTVEKIQEGTNHQPQTFHDPFLLFEMDKAVLKIKECICTEKKILIYGDYDADGITSTLILLETLESLGANVDYYLPNRFTDGYGPNLERWNQLISAHEYDLIITCDNGVAGHEAIDSMNQRGVEVIVTDHHELQETLPDAYAIIHPNHPEGDYPFKYLSGAGVALKVATAILGEIPSEGIELAAIGTVADMVPVQNENRTIILSGLNMMNNTLRPGLIQLLDKENINTNNINSDTIGFIIGPRLNAIGRLGDPSPALEMLRTTDDNLAKKYLELINEKNDERKTLASKIQSAVQKKIDSYSSLPLIIIEASPEWNVGVLGIVAGQISKQIQRPVMLFNYCLDERVYKGSARSINSLNIFQVLDAIKDYILFFGGHAQAAGLTIEESQWENFKRALNKYLVQFKNIIESPEILLIDLAIQIGQGKLDFIEEINLLGPFGPGNPEPLFLFQNVTVKELRTIGVDNNHIKLTIEDQQNSLKAIGFSMGDQFRGIRENNQISIVGHLNINEWKGNKTSQILIKDFGVNGPLWIDMRSSQIDMDIYTISNALYVFQNEKNLNLSHNYIDNSETIVYQELPKLDSYEYLVIMEPPKSIVSLKNILQNYKFDNVVLGSFIQHSKYMAGELKRAEFSKLYKFILKYPNLNYFNYLNEISLHLNIQYIKITYMFKVFLEAEFVTMNNGQLRLNSQLPQSKSNLREFNAFKEYHESLEAEKILNYQTINKIKKYFEGN